MIPVGAIFSPCRTWRYTLTRRSLLGSGTVAFIGLNPSTADEREDDQTIRRCIGFAESWGYGELIMLNLFGFRATDPEDMKAAIDPVGPDNDRHLLEVAGAADRVIAAWGVDGVYMERDRAVLGLLAEVELEALGFTAGGQPRHPLYMRGDTQPTTLERR